ncbi:mannosyl-3-phosphoglycerate phosphatase family [Stanieria cyanosphaera PCC 7437]|uniref:Mannosyl-3-phosphoglycerate phosphatase family n=1 Tax=Stanieria cyanosphaera (strain ATCC 29371 / PCC 7437) TaxID=111780 RepID=K9XR64_STAC7|nr:HAD-IIB family hydrolase [Stanieria cyanosphaera]AFZ35033.1 mannosyl-3-phosphoglycerate phosphatase family [Stanieria cyanosphaera PCC 7437]
MVRLIIFTDLDGTLLNQEDYDYQPAIAILNQLKKQQIPVIPVTSKTRSEVEGLRQEIDLSDPFIVENGSGIFIPQSSNNWWKVAQADQINQYHLHSLGCSYTKAREGLKKISADLEYNLQGFGDLSEQTIQSLTGLPPEEAKLAKQREFTEPFISPKQIDAKIVEDTAAKYGFRVLLGDRFSHLIDAQAGKGKAVRWLMSNHQLLAEEEVITVGLGNSPNDLEMLEAVDIPIVIASVQGVHPGLVSKGWQVAPAPGSQGWAEAVAAIYEQYL